MALHQIVQRPASLAQLSTNTSNPATQKDAQAFLQCYQLTVLHGGYWHYRVTDSGADAGEEWGIGIRMSRVWKLVFLLIPPISQPQKITTYMWVNSRNTQFFLILKGNQWKNFWRLSKPISSLVIEETRVETYLASAGDPWCLLTEPRVLQICCLCLDITHQPPFPMACHAWQRAAATESRPKWDQGLKTCLSNFKGLSLPSPALGPMSNFQIQGYLTLAVKCCWGVSCSQLSNSKGTRSSHSQQSSLF